MNSAKPAAKMPQNALETGDQKAPAKRMRTASLSEDRCGISNCSYPAKQIKKVDRHRQKEHEIEPHQSLLDCSVSASIRLELLDNFLFLHNLGHL